MPTLLTRTITLALTEEDYAAIERRAVGCTPTEAARDILLKALHADRFEVTLLGEMLAIRRLILNGADRRGEIDAGKKIDALKMLGYDTGLEE